MNASDNLGFGGAIEVLDEGSSESKHDTVAGAPSSESAKTQPSISATQPVSRRKGGRRGPHVPLAEAFRRSGLDEEQIAEYMMDLIEVCATKNEPKVMLDALKESSRCLENTKSAPLRVALVHDIPRPVRAPARNTPANEEDNTQNSNAASQ